MITLPQSNNDLGNLVEYMVVEHGLPEDYRELKIVHDPEQDRMNAAHARAFCYTTPQTWAIHCAAALEAICACARIGILLHEIGHIHQNAFNENQRANDLSEIAVDEWIVGYIPEAEYSYCDEIYQSQGQNRMRVARNLQRVSYAFARRISGE